MEIAGSPNIPISKTRKIRSNTAKTINKFPNDGVKSNLPLSLRRNQILKMFTKAPKTQTSYDKSNIKYVTISSCLTSQNMQ